MKNEFEVGDKVKAWGVDGEVAAVGEHSTYPINVRLKCNKSTAFTKDGKHEPWHNEPSLFLVEKAKNEEPIVQWYSVTAWRKTTSTPLTYSSLYTSTKNLLDRIRAKETDYHWIKLTPVCKTQGNKLVEVG